MNKISISLIIVITFFTTNIQAQKFNSAIEYLNHIGEEYGKISDDSWSYIRAAAHSNRARKIDKKRKELITTVSNAKKRVSKLPAYNGNTAFRDAIINYLTIDYQVMTEDYAKIVDMEEISEQSYDAMETYMTAKKMANEKLNKAADEVQLKQKIFAAENEITLNESNSKRSEKIKKANKVYEHYNVMYLIFFKSYKQEAYLIDAMSKKDVGALEQNNNALKQTSSEGLKKLSGVKTYKGDMTLVNATRNIFKFYQDESKNKVPKMIDFYLKKENFEKVQASFDKIKESKRTQDDVDKFNNALKEYNDGINVYNSINDELNKNRSKMLNDWNKAADSFTNKHVPRGK